MTPRPWLTVTSILALLVGIVLGLLLVPNLRTRAHVDDVASTSFDDRQRAWEWLKSSPGPLPLEQINLALRDAPPEALLHGAHELQRLQAWNWATQSNEVMARYFEKPFPARAVVGVASLPLDSPVEVEGVMIPGSGSPTAN